MDSQDTKNDRLDNVISIIESSLLKTTDKEIVSASQDVDKFTSDVKSIISRHLIAQSHTKHPQQDADNSNIRPVSRRVSSKITSDITKQLVMLRKLIATQPDVALRMRSVFGGGNNRSTHEIDKLFEEIVPNVIGRKPKKDGKD